MRLITVLIIFSIVLFSGCSNSSITVIDTPLDVAIQDQTTEPVILYLSEKLADVTLNQATNIDDINIFINSPIAPVTGNYICLKENSHFYQSEIISVTNLGGNNYQVTVNTPLDYAFTINGGCSLRNINLNVDGSTTPRVFSVSPSRLNVDWDITRMIIHIEDNNVMDTNTFGGVSYLSKGVVFRVVDGYTKNLFTVRSNGDFMLYGYDGSFDDKAPAGFYGFTSRITFNGQEKMGVVVRLESATNDSYQAIVQDDLRGLTKFNVMIQGHVVQP